MKCLISFVSVLIFAISSSATIIIYPSPQGEPLSKDYSVKINGRILPVHQARVSAAPINQVWPGYQRPIEQSELASYCSFDTDETVTVSVTSTVKVKDVVIRPLSYNIKPIVKGNVITFTVSHPAQLTVEVNGWHKALHMFVNPLVKNIPDRNDPDVLYFPAGVHKTGIIHARDNQTIYLEGGAIVHGVIYVQNVKNCKIMGRGVLDASTIGRFDARNIIFVDSSENISVEGVTLKDAQSWAFMVFRSKNITIENIKLIGNWRYNSDGIDIVNSSDVSVSKSFVRAFDDCIVLKGILKEPGVVKNIHIDSCVLWNDWGRALEIGAETAADSMYSISFSNIDIIHYVHIAMDIQNGDRAHIYDVSYENINIEEPIVENAYYDNKESPIKNIQQAKSYNPLFTHTPQQLGLLIEMNIRANNYSRDTVRGTVRNIQFKQIRYRGTHDPASVLVGYSAEHSVGDIIFKDLFINERKITSTEEGRFRVNDFVQDVVFQ